jgi:hypothetical protein
VLRLNPDGTSLSTVLSATSGLGAIHAVGDGTAWLLLRDPSSSRVYHLLPPDSPDQDPRWSVPAGMYDIWAAPDGTVWLAGEGGALLRKPPQ